MDAGVTYVLLCLRAEEQRSAATSKPWLLLCRRAFANFTRSGS